MSAARVAVGALALALAGCTLVAGLPSVQPEESAPACANGVDDDLDGETDCADRSCRDFCWEGEGLQPPAASPCFEDEECVFAYRLLSFDSRYARCESDLEP